MAELLLERMTARPLSGCGGRKFPLKGKDDTRDGGSVGCSFITAHITPSVQGGVVNEPVYVPCVFAWHWVAPGMGNQFHGVEWRQHDTLRIGILVITTISDGVACYPSQHIMFRRILVITADLRSRGYNT